MKRDVFARLGKVAKPDAVLATNTSSFYVRDLAQGDAESRARDRPALLLSTRRRTGSSRSSRRRETSKAAIERAQAIQDALGKTAIVCADAPGFIVNRFFVPWLNEAVRLLAEKVADIPTIEAAAKEAFGVGHGPVRADERDRDPDRAPRRDDARAGARPLLRAGAAARRAGEARAALEARRDAGRRAASPRSPRGCSAMSFLVAAAIVDEKVGTIEDVDIGARVGLRWPLGPFELMNKIRSRRGREARRGGGQALRARRSRRRSLARREPFRFSSSRRRSRIGSRRSRSTGRTSSTRSTRKSSRSSPSSSTRRRDRRRSTAS